jgi:hypothetical protein
MQLQMTWLWRLLGVVTIPFLIGCSMPVIWRAIDHFITNVAMRVSKDSSRSGWIWGTVAAVVDMAVFGSAALFCFLIGRDAHAVKSALLAFFIGIGAVRLLGGNFKARR